MGLWLAYAGSHREDLLTLLLPHVADENMSTEIASLSVLALGFVFLGSGNREVNSTISQTLMQRVERDPKSLDERWARLIDGAWVSIVVPW
jgi:26S proteasome regulatory subunit N1